MLNGEKNNWPMWAGSCTEESVELGLVTSHAYTVLSVYEIEDNNNKLRLIKLRNPWGKGEWKGDYSDNSNKWTKELKNNLRIKTSFKEDGVFYMTFDDFKK